MTHDQTLSQADPKNSSQSPPVFLDGDAFEFGEPDEAVDGESLLEFPEGEPFVERFELETPWNRADKYSFKTEQGWSEPIPEPLLVFKREEGLLDADTEVRLAALDGEESAEVRSLSDLTATLDDFTVQSFNVATSREIMDEIQSGADALEKYTTAAQQWKTGEKTLEKLAKATRYLTTASTGLGVFGAGLGVVQAILGEEQDTDRILNAIEEVGEQVSSLQTFMNQKLEYVIGQVEVNHARTQLRPHVDMLETIRENYHLYTKNLDNAAQRSIYEDRLLEFKRSDIHTCVKSIYKHFYEPLGILQATKKATFGDYDQIWNQGQTIYDLIVFASMADALISRLLEERKGGQRRELTAEEIHELGKSNREIYHPYIAMAPSLWILVLNECRVHYFLNMIQKMELEILPRLSANAKKSAAATIRQALKEQWPWLDWCAIVYDPVGGFENHAWKGWLAKSWFRRSVVGGRVNVIVKCVDSKSTPSGSSTKTQPQDYDKFDLYLHPNGRIEAEDYSWDDMRDCLAAISPSISSPGMVFACRRYKDVWVSYNNPRRIKVVTGEYSTMVVYR